MDTKADSCIMQCSYNWFKFVPSDIPIEYLISQASLWNYLTSHGEWGYIQQWIQASFPLPGEPGETIVWNQALPKTLGPEVADQLHHCTSYLKERILKELARYCLVEECLRILRYR